jgi:hypothetical protein
MIKLTKDVGGKKVELDIIFLNGKAIVRDKCFSKLEKEGLSKQDLKDVGYDLEVDEIDKIKAKKSTL